MQLQLEWTASMQASLAGKDYPEGEVDPNEPPSRFWTEMEEYEPYFDQWRTRWEYQSRFRPRRAQ